MSTYDKILDAAMDIVREEGVVRLTLDAAAKRAGISKGGVLYHFKSKDDLIRGMVKRLLDHCDAMHAAAYQRQPEGPYRWLRTMIEVTFDPEGPTSDRIGGALLAALALNPELMAPIEARYDEWMADVRSDSPDLDRAALVCMALDGHYFDTMLGLAPYDSAQLDRIRRTALDLLK